MDQILRDMLFSDEKIDELERYTLNYADMTFIDEKASSGKVLSYTRSGENFSITLEPIPGSSLEDYLSLSL